MPRVDDRLIAATARIGSFLALGLALRFGTAAAIPFWLFVPLWLLLCWRLAAAFGSPDDQPTSGVPVLPLTVVMATLLSPSLLLLHGASESVPHWFSHADDGYTLMIARGLRQAFPPPDLSWAGMPVRYHHGAPLLVDLLSRLTFLPVHTIYYGLLPIVLKIILVASVLEVARRIAPDLSPNVRVWVPLAVSGLFTIDFYNVAWHAHDLLVRGRAAIGEVGMPIFTLYDGLFTRPTFDSGWLAVPLIVILLATWKTSTPIEQASVLFAIFLVKPQVFLAAGAGFGIVALVELRNRNWRPFGAAALALVAVLMALPIESTYDSMTHLTLACGAECLQLIDRHALSAKFPLAVLMPAEIVLYVMSFHLFALVLLRARRTSEEARLAMLIALAGLSIAFGLRLVPTAVLRTRFLAVYTPIAGRLFMPLPVYLDRVFGIAVDSAYDAFTRLLPLVVIPLALSSRRLRWLVVIVAAVSLWNIRPNFEQAKEITSDAMNVLCEIPPGSHVILTNDLAYDDLVEKHLPLLNIWAPAATGQQFWASAFMFNFQYAEAADRLRQVDWFFSQASDAERVRFARAAGIDLVFAREHPIAGWRLIARDGRYELYSRPKEGR